jgi:hypothetical protein
MSHFYSVVRGQGKTEATRRGSEKSGIEATAASYEGAVNVELRVKDGIDWAMVRLIPWHGGGINAVLYDGPVGGPHGKISEVDEALRCKMCLHFKNWESFTNGPMGNVSPSAPEKKE